MLDALLNSLTAGVSGSWERVASHFDVLPGFQWLLSTQATGGTALGIKSARLQLLPIPVPPLKEQARIAARVEQLLQLCGELHKAVDSTRQVHVRIAEAVIRAALQRKP